MNFWQRLKQAWENNEDFEIEFEAWHLIPVIAIVLFILLALL